MNATVHAGEACDQTASRVDADYAMIQSDRRRDASDDPREDDLTCASADAPRHARYAKASSRADERSA